jgi:hypothetical protein
MHAWHAKPCPAKAYSTQQNQGFHALIPSRTRCSRGSACVRAAAGSSVAQDTVDVAVIGSGIIGRIHQHVLRRSCCQYSVTGDNDTQLCLHHGWGGRYWRRAKHVQSRLAARTYLQLMQHLKEACLVLYVQACVLRGSCCRTLTCQWRCWMPSSHVLELQEQVNIQKVQDS